MFSDARRATIHETVQSWLDGNVNPRISSKKKHVFVLRVTHNENGPTWNIVLTLSSIKALSLISGALEQGHVPALLGAHISYSQESGLTQGNQIIPTSQTVVLLVKVRQPGAPSLACVRFKLFSTLVLIVACLGTGFFIMSSLLSDTPPMDDDVTGPFVD